MRNILLKIKYDGKNYHGWQVQNNASSVQEDLQNALYKVIDERPDIKGCSRTDAGVHANMYCISFKTEHTIPSDRLPHAINRFLPEQIAAFEARDVSEDFHARYSCKGKEYIYKIHNAQFRDPFLSGYAMHYWQKLDDELMRKAAVHFLGTHDFTSFCTVDAKRQKGDFHRTIKNLDVTRCGDMVYITVEADGFLYNMVRIIVGTLMYVAQGKFLPDDIPDIINALDRKKAGPTAIPDGLYLNRVIY